MDQDDPVVEKIDPDPIKTPEPQAAPDGDEPRNAVVDDGDGEVPAGNPPTDALTER